ncbi:uncharacterized protein LOC143453324 isoform X2 [Clavelina lepadiformis]|uniref:uncharacterized protein LOC143453324 isoform X2 n=1 Tax=Clavelina lepadiformis TaxID=159417 RepID=UPI0040412220
MPSADQASPKQTEDTVASVSSEDLSILSTSYQTSSPPPSTERPCGAIVHHLLEYPLKCRDFYLQEVGWWQEEISLNIFFVVCAIVCLFIAKNLFNDTTIYMGDGRGEDGIDDVEVGVIEQSDAMDDYEEDYIVAGVEDRQSLAIRSDDESIQDIRRENVVHALVHRDNDHDGNEERRQRATAGAGNSRRYQETEV